MYQLWLKDTYTIKKLLKENKISQIIWNKIYLPNEILIEDKIIKILNDNDTSYKIFSSSLLLEPKKTRKKDDTPFQVFTPFWKNEENLYLNKYNYKNYNHFLISFF